MSKLPIFYHKSTIVAVDDDALVLKAVSQLLDSIYQVKTFTQPEKCIEYFSDYTSPLSKVSLIRGCKEHEYYETSNHAPVDLDVTKLHLIKDCEDEISVMIVDYNMPNMNGIELCRKLLALPVKKILLTGEAEFHHAITALNDNIIDCYLQKDSQTLGDDLQSYVTGLSKQYYYDRTLPLISHLEAEYNLPISDPIFNDFFQSWCMDNAVTEYTLIDKNGSFVVTDRENKRLHFIVHTDRSLCDFLKLNDDNEDASIYLSSVNQREKIPYFGIGKESWQFDVRDWDSHFFTPNKLVGNENYYWVVV